MWITDYTLNSVANSLILSSVTNPVFLTGEGAHPLTFSQKTNEFQTVGVGAHQVSLS